MIGKRIGLPLLACLVAGGCGGSGSTHSSTLSIRSSAAATAAQNPPGAPSGLAGIRGRTLIANELKGFSPSGQRQAGFTPASWVVVDQVPSTQRASVLATLQRLGFVAGVREDLVGPDGLAGLSTVEQYRTASGAHAELTAVATTLTGPGTKRLSVAGVPGARGYDNAGTAANIVFAEGAYFYLVGTQEAPSGTPGAPNQATLAAAAQSLYRRVHQ